MTNFFPFFLECSKQEVDNDRKKELESLAFGNALVITKGNKNILITDTEEFVIPDDFSLESWNDFKICYGKTKIQLKTNLIRGMLRRREIKYED